jgi:MFS family permease
VLIISQIGTVLAFSMFIIAIPLEAWNDSLGLVLPMSNGMFVLFTARILNHIPGGNITTAQAYISDVTDSKHRAQDLGLLQAAFRLGFIFGSAFGGVLSNINPIVPFIGAAIITIGFFGSLAFAALPATFALYANHLLFPDLAGTGRVQLFSCFPD